MSELRKVLIVDDSKLVLALHANMLKGKGFECTFAENGFLALEACSATQFDLILTDINMPKMDGYEFIRKARGSAGYAHVPIIIISTEQEARDKSIGLAAGANVYVVKPVSAENLLLCVNMLLGA